jgi:DNA primase
MNENESTYKPIIKILDGILGDYRAHNKFNGQIAYDCPVCSYEIKGLDHGDGKGNLEINYINEVYKCWSCCDTHNTHGSLEGLIRKYGNSNQLNKYKILKPDEAKLPEKKQYEKVILPKEFIPFSDVSEGFKLTHYYKQAKKYIDKRHITDEIIKKHNIGFCYQGYYQNRIIIPSYDKKRRLNYFVARSYENKPIKKYLNPRAEKEIIIFNEYLINWDKPIYLVEGAFDSIFIPNSIPLLGKQLSEELFALLYKKAKNEIIIILDPDAISNAEIIYYKLNGGVLYGRIWLIKLYGDKDIADLFGDLTGYEKEQLR